MQGLRSNNFRSISQVAPYFEASYGYAVWPRIARGGLGIGASRGRGQVFVGGQLVGYSRLVEVSIGLQAGGQTYRQIIFFEESRGFRELLVRRISNSTRQLRL